MKIKSGAKPRIWDMRLQTIRIAVLALLLSVNFSRVAFSAEVLIEPLKIQPPRGREVLIEPVKIQGPRDRNPLPQPAPDELAGNFVLGQGDALKITVWGYAELSHEIVILPDGNFSYPLLGPVNANGLTVQDLTELLRQKLLQHIEDPHVTVTVSEMRSRRFSVIGAVKNPGTFPLWNENSTVLEAVANAGGWNEDALAGHIKIFRHSASAETQAIHVDLESLVENDVAVGALKIMPGDVIYIPSRASQPKIRVLGEVNAPGLYNWMPGMSAMDALGMAGWLRGSGTSKKILLVRREGDGKQKTFLLNLNVKEAAGKKEWKDDIKLHPGDIIFVQEKLSSKVSHFVNYLTSTAEPASRTYLGIYDATNPADFVVNRN